MPEASSGPKSPAPTAITVCTVVICGSTGASWAIRELSAMTIWSSASLAMYAICSGDNRMLRVWSTAPIDGMARYATVCSALFHMNVATR